jgi:hypothetical protein
VGNIQAGQQGFKGAGVRQIGGRLAPMSIQTRGRPPSGICASQVVMRPSVP